MSVNQIITQLTALKKHYPKGEAEAKFFFFDRIFSAINEYKDNDDLICFGLNDNLFEKLRFPLILDFNKIPEWEFYNLNRFRSALAKDPQNLFEEELLDKLPQWI